MDVEQTAQVRETEVYPALFGPPAGAIARLDLERFTRRFRQSTVEPHWLECGVLAFAPTPERASWAYVTSGLSHPAEGQAAVEFVLQTPRPGDWAVAALQNMLAFELLHRAGRYPKSRPLAPGDRVPLREPIDGRPDCLIRNLVVSEAEGVPASFDLPSGPARLYSFTGLTDDELAYAQAYGTEAILDKLRKVGFHPVTDPERPTIIRRAAAQDR